MQLKPCGATTESQRKPLGTVLLTVSTMPSISSIVMPVQGLAALHCRSAMTSLVVVPFQFLSVRSRMLNSEVSQPPLAVLYEVHCLVVQISSCTWEPFRCKLPTYVMAKIPEALLSVNYMDAVSLALCVAADQMWLTFSNVMFAA